MTVSNKAKVLASYAGANFSLTILLGVARGGMMRDRVIFDTTNGTRTMSVKAVEQVRGMTLTPQEMVDGLAPMFNTAVAVCAASTLGWDGVQRNWNANTWFIGAIPAAEYGEMVAAKASAKNLGTPF